MPPPGAPAAGVQPPPGAEVAADAQHTDVLIVGAGPTGLYLAFQLGLLGLTSRIVDVLPQAGGQCIELFPDTPIYDIPGQPRCTGRELSAQLLQQMAPFGFALHLNELVSTLEAVAPGGWTVGCQSGTVWQARAVCLTAGVGAFLPRPLQAEGADAAVGHGLFYQLDNLAQHAGQHVLVVGGDDLALDWLLQLANAPAAEAPASLTLLYRRPALNVAAERQQQFDALCAQGRVHLVVGQASRISCADPGASAPHTGGVRAMWITPPEGDDQALPCTHILAATGISPRLGPLAQWGLELHRKQLPVTPANGSTARPGLFAAGDLVTYPGKKKLIACGFHEAVMAAFGLAEYLNPGQVGPLQYTTSSALLQRRLGLAPRP